MLIRRARWYYRVFGGPTAWVHVFETKVTRHVAAQKIARALGVSVFDIELFGRDAYKK